VAGRSAGGEASSAQNSVTKRGGAQMMLMACPYCCAKVRSDRLTKHVSRIHSVSRPGSGSSPKSSRQAKSAKLAKQRAGRVRSGFRTVQCSFCGLRQRSSRKRLTCVRCKRTDNNPVIVKHTDLQRNANRKPCHKTQSPVVSRPPEYTATPAVPLVPVPRGRARRSKRQAQGGCGMSARSSFVKLDWWRERGE
jgi:hypothetical protein